MWEEKDVEVGPQELATAVSCPGPDARSQTDTQDLAQDAVLSGLAHQPPEPCELACMSPLLIML